MTRYSLSIPLRLTHTLTRMHPNSYNAPTPGDIVSNTLPTEDVIGMIGFINKALSQLSDSIYAIQERTQPVRVCNPPKDPGEPAPGFPPHYPEATCALKRIENEVWRLKNWADEITCDLRI